MYLNFRGVIKVTGVFYVVLGIVMLLPFLVGIIYGEKESIYAFSLVAFPLIIIGLLLSKIKPSPVPFKNRDGFLIVCIAWLSATLFGSLPFLISGCCDNFPDAYLEACSGFSTTGATIFNDVEVLPRAILFWRCFTHFLGGLGILYMVIALLPALGFDGQTIARSELTGPTFSKLVPKTSTTSRLLFSIYISLTVLETILLLLGGLSFFDAITHAFSTMGTGGMSNYNDSVAHFDSIYVEVVITVFMLLAGINFNLYYIAAVRGPKEFFMDLELRTYLGIIAIITVLVSVYNAATGMYGSLPEAIRYALFNIVSLLTTTGFCNTNYDLWDAFPLALFFLLYFIGGCASSTGGGIKVSRIVVVAKLIKRGVRVRLHPNAIIKINMNDKVLSTDTVESVTGFIFTYLSLIFVSTILIAADGHDFTTSLSTACASIGNVGPGFNGVGPAMNYSIFSGPVKIFLSLLMLAGRLEIYTFLTIFSRRFWNPNR